MTAEPASKWFLYPDRPEAPTALYCLPHSGAGATAYRPWVTAAPEDVAVRPLQLPGRESRINETPRIDVADIADVLAAESRPYALYGHSMGSLLAYDVVAELRRRPAALPRVLFVGASRAPDDPADFVHRALALDDQQFLREVVDMGGTPAEITEHPALAALIVPILRADFGWIDRRSIEKQPPLDVPIIGFTGSVDRMAPPAVMNRWEAMTTQYFRRHTIPGGHFFHVEEAETVLGIVRTELAHQYDSAGRRSGHQA